MHPIETPDKTFHDGDGVSELGTILPAWWLNQVQSELLAVLTAAGIQPDKSQPNQLLAALNRLVVVITANQEITGQKTFTAQTQFKSGIHLSANPTHWNAGYKAYIGADTENAHIVFGDDTLRLHSTQNRISYNNYDIFHKANKPRFNEDIEGKPNTLAGYGIGNFKVETFRGDLNTLKTDGIYSLPTAVGSSHLPVENTACHIQVIAGTQPGWCRQLGYVAYTGDVYERHQTSSANDDWSPWKKLNSDGNDKADRAHTHTAAQITDFSAAVSNAVNGILTGNAAENGWLKLPNGILMQWGKATIEGVHRQKEIFFPVAFREIYSIASSAYLPNATYWGNMSGGVVIRSYTKNKFAAQVSSSYEDRAGSDTCILWFAVGKAA